MHRQADKEQLVEKLFHGSGLIGPTEILSRTGQPVLVKVPER